MPEVMSAERAGVSFQMSNGELRAARFTGDEFRFHRIRAVVGLTVELLVDLVKDALLFFQVLDAFRPRRFFGVMEAHGDLGVFMVVVSDESFGVVVVLADFRILVDGIRQAPAAFFPHLGSNGF